MWLVVRHYSQFASHTTCENTGTSLSRPNNNLRWSVLRSSATDCTHDKGTGQTIFAYCLCCRHLTAKFCEKVRRWSGALRLPATFCSSHQHYYLIHIYLLRMTRTALQQWMSGVCASVWSAHSHRESYKVCSSSYKFLADCSVRSREHTLDFAWAFWTRRRWETSRN